jgi:hypothetical protein
MAVASLSPGASSGADGVAGRASRVVFDAAPGKMELRLSVEGGSGVLDSEVREIVVPDLTSTQTSLGTPVLFRGRTPRDIQQLKADPQAVPATDAKFSRTGSSFMRVAAYGAGAPCLGPHAQPRVRRCPNYRRRQPRLSRGDRRHPVAGPLLASIVEVKATGESGEAKELVKFASQPRRVHAGGAPAAAAATGPGAGRRPAARVRLSSPSNARARPSKR